MPIQFKLGYDEDNKTQTLKNSNSHSFVQFDKKL